MITRVPTLSALAAAAGVAALAAATVSTPAQAGPLKFGDGPAPGFDVFSVDDNGGGWVIHRMPGRGHTLWACTDLAKVDECTQLYFDEWKTATSMEMIHVTDKSQKAWLKMSVPGMGDYLFACSDPEGEASCSRIELELRPDAMPTLERVWPEYPCTFACGDADSCCGEPLKPSDPRAVIEPASHGNMWLQLKSKLGGPVNLYACRDLESEPICELTVPNWLALDRENLGFKKLEDIETEGEDGEILYGPGVRIGKIDEESAAYELGFREGDVILAVGDYETNRAKHARSLMMQYPAEAPIPLTKEDGSVVELVGRRKPKKK